MTDQDNTVTSGEGEDVGARDGGLACSFNLSFDGVNHFKAACWVSIWPCILLPGERCSVVQQYGSITTLIIYHIYIIISLFLQKSKDEYIYLYMGNNSAYILNKSRWKSFTRKSLCTYNLIKVVYLLIIYTFVKIRFIYILSLNINL